MPIRWPEAVQRGPFVGGQFGACRKGGEDISDASFVQKKTGITVRAEHLSERAGASRRQCEAVNLVLLFMNFPEQAGVPLVHIPFVFCVPFS